MFLKNKNIIFKIRRSKVTDYAALSIEANSMDPKQTAPIWLLKHFSRREKQTTFVAVGALRVKKSAHKSSS